MATYTSYVLDCEGLSRTVRGERGMLSRIKDAHRSGIRVVTEAP